MTRRYIFKAVVSISFIAVAFFVAGCSDRHQAEPILKIITVTSNRLNFSGTNEYYIAYGSGKIEKTSEFVPSDTMTYYFIPSDKTTNYLPENINENGSVILKNIDVNTAQGKKLNEVAGSIILLLNEENLKIVSINRLFILGERYFFDVLYDAGKKDAGCKLFEYIPSDNRIDEVVNLDSKSIEHIELHDSG